MTVNAKHPFRIFYRKMKVFRQIQAMGTTMDLVIPHFDEKRIPVLMHHLYTIENHMSRALKNIRKELGKYNLVGILYMFLFI
jgi:hypothetical protein